MKILQRLIPKGKKSEEWKEVRRETMLELVEEIKERLGKKKLILMLDEIRTLTATASFHYYELMQEKNIIFFTAGTKNI